MNLYNLLWEGDLIPIPPPPPAALFQLGINNNSRQIIASEIGWQSGIREFGSAALRSSDPWLKGEALD